MFIFVFNKMYEFNVSTNVFNNPIDGLIVFYPISNIFQYFRTDSLFQLSIFSQCTFFRRSETDDLGSDRLLQLPSYFHFR